MHYSSAIGAGQRGLSSDDIFIRPNEVAAPKNRIVAIDILIRPTDGTGATVDVFPQGSPWLELWGFRALYKTRTAMIWRLFVRYTNGMLSRASMSSSRRFLKDWQKDGAKGRTRNLLKGPARVR